MTAKVTPEFLRVLCVDDQPSMRAIIRNVLRRWGIRNVTEAGDGMEAFKCLQKTQMDLVITDWTMPNVTGLQLFKAIKKNEKFSGIPVIMVTGNVKEEQVRYAITSGVRFFLSKPLSPLKLKSRLEAAIGQLDEPSMG